MGTSDKLIMLAIVLVGAVLVYFAIRFFNTSVKIECISIVCFALCIDEYGEEYLHIIAENASRYNELPPEVYDFVRSNIKETKDIESLPISRLKYNLIMKHPEDYQTKVLPHINEVLNYYPHSSFWRRFL